MNICIVSVFNSTNQGSFQQLKELGDVYSKYGDVFYLDCGIRSIWKGATDYFVRCCFKFKFKKALYDLKKRRIFKKRYGKLKRITLADIDKMDMFVLGSDEIWNVARADMRHPFLFGVGLGKPTVSYAPSVGNTDAESMRSYNYTVAGFNKLAAVSVRDGHSEQVLIDSGCTLPIEILVDPTFLKSREQYMSEHTQVSHGGYVALYCFQGVLDKSGECSSCFAEFAQEKGLKLLSGGVWSEYADNIHCEQACTFDYYIDADYVIANTFHGTAFAINLNKQFVTFSCGKEKIKELLVQLGLEDRDCTGKTKEEIFAILNTPIDYDSVNAKLGSMREVSLDYIRRSVELVKQMQIGEK